MSHRQLAIKIAAASLRQQRLLRIAVLCRRAALSQPAR